MTARRPAASAAATLALAATLTVTLTATLGACAASADHLAGPEEGAEAAAARLVPVAYELRLAGETLADGAVMLGIRGITVDSVAAGDAVATLAGTVDGEARVVLAGALAGGVTLRVWGSGPAGAVPDVALREAVDGATLESRALPARAAVAARRL